jgi:diadenylate cyclase
MNEFILFIRQWIIPPIEIIIITVVIYNIYKILVRTRAIPILKGIGIIIIAFVLASFLRMEIILWILQSGLQLFAFALIVIFSQEIRRIFAKLGTNSLFSRILKEKNPETVEIITETVEDLAQTKTGALIVFEKNVGLRNYIERSGIKIDGLIKKELLLTIFFKNTALHDGAVVCKDDRIVAAGVVLPTSTRPDIDKLFGVRHRAGIGITEESDAIAVIVSEETGKISIAEEGKINYNLDSEKFRKMLSELLFNEKEGEEEKNLDLLIKKGLTFIRDKTNQLKKRLKVSVKNNDSRNYDKEVSNSELTQSDEENTLINENENNMKENETEEKRDIVSNTTSKN